MVLVLGLARSGFYAAILLHKLGYKVVVADLNAHKYENEVKRLKELNIEIVNANPDDELLQRDFKFVVKNPGINYKADFVLKIKKLNIPIYNEIDIAYSQLEKHNFVSITGTNGKTTVTTLTKLLLGKKGSYAGNIGVPLSKLALENNYNTEHNFVLELSNFQLLDIKKLHPKISVVLNLTPDHLDYMSSVEEYYESKMLIYLNQTKNDFFLLNIDDEKVLEYAQNIPCKIVEFSLDKKCNGGYYNDSKLYFYDEIILDTKIIKLVGRHNLQNILVSVIIAKLLNVDNQTIIETIKNFIGVEHRIEFVKEVSKVKYYNDSKATNPDATIVAVNSFNKDNLILLLGGKDKHLDLIELKNQINGVKQLIVYGETKMIMKDLVSNTIIVDNLKQAVEKANKIAKANDIVLLSPACASYDQFTNFEQRGNYFKELVNKL